MTSHRFQRARKPEEKAVRREAILETAQRLVTEIGPVELTLSELGRRSGVSKPNIYRYFESREDVLRQLWIEEVRKLVERLGSALESVAIGDIEATAAIIAAAFAAQPQLCELTSIMATVIEPQLSVAAVMNTKLALVDLIASAAGMLHAKLPALSLPGSVWAVQTIAAHVPGAWPAANPRAATAEVLARPEFAEMRIEFEGDFAHFVRVLLTGLTS